MIWCAIAACRLSLYRSDTTLTCSPAHPLTQVIDRGMVGVTSLTFLTGLFDGLCLAVTDTHKWRAIPRTPFVACIHEVGGGGGGFC